MPMTTFGEYEAYREKYTRLVEAIQGCFDDSLLRAGGSAEIDFDAKKALAVARDFLPYSMDAAHIAIRL